MIEYPALIDGVEGAYGVVFPDIPGVGAMGDTVDEALVNAEAALKDYAAEAEIDGEELADPSPLQSIGAGRNANWQSLGLHTSDTNSSESARAGLIKSLPINDAESVWSAAGK